MTQGPPVRVVPITLARANRYVAEHHRHHAPMPPGLTWWGVAAVDPEGGLVGVAIAGRPSNRNSDDGQTVEVQRVATDGTRNACSALYGACARAAKAIGASKVITYTLESESGASLRGAGWVREKEGIGSYWMDAKTRTPAVARSHMVEQKVRWAKHFREPLSLAPESVDESPDNQLTLSLALGPRLA